MKTVLLWAIALVSLPALAQNPGVITTIAGTGVEGYNGDNKPAAQAQLDWSTAEDDDQGNVYYDYAHPAVDKDGNIYIPDKANFRIRKIDRSGIITTVAGNGTEGPSGNNGPATQAQLDFPASVAFDAAGNFYIVDEFNNRVRKVSPAGIITNVVGVAYSGQCDLGGNGGPAALAQLCLPGGLAIGPDGSLYISDTFNQQVRRVSPNGVITAFAGLGFDNTDQAFGGDGGPAAEASLFQPAGLAFDSNGNLYIADEYNNRIRKVAPGGIITTIAGNGDAGFAGEGQPATSATLNHPTDVAVDAAGNLYIADQYNNRVRKVTPGGIISTVAGNGIHGYGGDGGPPLQAALDYPSGVTFDLSGNLLIVDHHNMRLRRVVFNPPALAGAPARFDFAATAGGADPAVQTFALTNAGAGLLNFTIASDSTWLSATPVSGSLTGTATTVTVRAAIASLREGQYTGNLTLNSAEAANSPQIIVVSLTVRPAAAPSPAFTAAGVVHAASFVAGPVAPGEIVTIFGSNVGPATSVGAALDPATNRLAATRGGVTVLFNDIPGAPFYVQRDQINVQAPYELAGQTSARIVVRYLDGASAPVTVPVAAAAPGIFTASSGRGQAALLNQDFSFNSATNPAALGSVIQIYLTGQGATNPLVLTGQLPTAPFPVPALPVTVSIGGRPAPTKFVGLAPGFAGLLQVNAVVPDDVVPGDNVALTVAVGDASTQTGVTIAVRRPATSQSLSP
jgi:uncharacterized protein (TIGR03437 family)